MVSLEPLPASYDKRRISFIRVLDLAAWDKVGAKEDSEEN